MSDPGKKEAVSVWGASPAGSTHVWGLHPGTCEFFEAVLRRRSTEELPWLQELVPFAKMTGRRVLEVGCGAGYDAYEFCRHGAFYTGIDITPQNIERTRKHLAFYGLTPDLHVADAEALPFPDARFDGVFSNGVLHHTPDILRSLREAQRVLAAGGEARIIVYHRDSIFFWLHVFLFDHILGFGFLRRSLRERLSMIEYTTAKERPLVNVYSRRQMRNLMTQAGFRVDSVDVRKLQYQDLPAIPVVSRLWPHIPRRALDWLGRRFGWYVIVKGTKS